MAKSLRLQAFAKSEAGSLLPDHELQTSYDAGQQVQKLSWCRIRWGNVSGYLVLWHSARVLMHSHPN